MRAMEHNERAADVICQHRRDGSVIPLKIRIMDDDGEYQTYLVRAYKDLTHPGEYKLPNGVNVYGRFHKFECKIIVFGVEKRLQLLYNTATGIWLVQ